MLLTQSSDAAGNMLSRSSPENYCTGSRRAPRAGSLPLARMLGRAVRVWRKRHSPARPSILRGSSLAKQM